MGAPTYANSLTRMFSLSMVLRVDILSVWSHGKPRYQAGRSTSGRLEHLSSRLWLTSMAASAFDVMWKLRRSMDFPQLPLDESLKRCEGMRILHNACCHLLRSIGAL